MLTILIPQWMGNTWYSPPVVSATRDINGNVIIVGDTVRIVGVIAALSPISGTQRATIAFNFAHPELGSQDYINVDSLNLIKGS